MCQLFTVNTKNHRLILLLVPISKFKFCINQFDNTFSYHYQQKNQPSTIADFFPSFCLVFGEALKCKLNRKKLAKSVSTLSSTIIVFGEAFNVSIGFHVGI